MIRQIIHIDEEKCNGCGLCASACHEGAIEMVNGKAKLVRENFCDGFGDCLPGCPTGAITFETREAPDYDEAAVKASKESKAEGQAMTTEEIMKIEEQFDKEISRLVRENYELKSKFSVQLDSLKAENQEFKEENELLKYIIMETLDVSDYQIEEELDRLRGITHEA